MKTFYRIFGGKCRERALILFALVSTLQLAAQPEAWLTGGASICPSATATVQVNFNLGLPPFIIVYSIDGATFITENNVTDNPFIITTSTPGVYALEEVYNSDGNPGTITGSSVTITGLPLPGADGVISGSGTVCQGHTGVSYSVAAISDETS